MSLWGTISQATFGECLFLSSAWQSGKFIEEGLKSKYNQLLQKTKLIQNGLDGKIY